MGNHDEFATALRDIIEFAKGEQNSSAAVSTAPGKLRVELEFGDSPSLSRDVLKRIAAVAGEGAA